MPRKQGFPVAIVVALYVALAAGIAATRMPICDEAYYGMPGRQLYLEGNTGTPVIEPAGSYLTDIDRVTYWEMPLHLFWQAGWYRLFGFSLFTLRGISVMFGALGLLSWYLFFRKTTQDAGLSLIAISVLAIDYTYYMVTTVGRSDAMSFCLGSAALASFVLLREKSMPAALLSSHTLTAASGMTHPIGGVIALAGLVYLSIEERRRWKGIYWAAALLPYAIGGLLWLMYILPDIPGFLAQFGGNSQARLSVILHPLAALKGEITGRYLTAFGLAPALSSLHRVRLFVLLLYLVGLVVSWRNHGPGVRLLQRLFLLNTVILLVMEGAKQPWYVIYALPYFAFFVALLWQRRRAAWRLAVVAVGLVQAAGLFYSMRQDHYGKSYLPAVAFCQGRVGPSTLVMGPAELSFGIRPPHLIEDHNFGFYSGKTPDLIVLGPDDGVLLKKLRQNGGPVYQHVEAMLLDDYDRVYAVPPYTVLAKRK